MPPRPKTLPDLHWRDFLRPDEAAKLACIDAAKSQWQALSVERPGIVGRAIRRAKYAMSKERADA